jgi:acyl transferase domain-containing protein
MRHKTIPPVPTSSQPNPRIDFASTPFYVSREASAWQAAGPRMAGVSAFGVGGVNAHVVLEEAPEASPEPSARPAQLLCVSARSEAALDAALGNLGRHLQPSIPRRTWRIVSYTLQTGRHGFDHRASLACSSVDEAARMLAEPGNRQIHRSSGILNRPQPVFLFTGQGAQFPGWAARSTSRSPCIESRSTNARRFCGPCWIWICAHCSFRRMPNAEASAEALLMETRLAQPALFITELAMASLWMEWGIEPKAMTGTVSGSSWPPLWPA